MKKETGSNEQKPVEALNVAAVTRRIPCKKIRAGQYEYRGWIISCVGYYEPDQRVCWEAYDPKTGFADFHGFSKREIKWLIDYDVSKNSG